MIATLEVSVCDGSLPYTSVVAGEHKVLDGFLMVSVVGIKVMLLFDMEVSWE